MPGQIATPVRLGRARQGIFNPGVAELAGLDAERIVQVREFHGWLLRLWVTRTRQWQFNARVGRAELAGLDAERTVQVRPSSGSPVAGLMHYVAAPV